MGKPDFCICENKGAKQLHGKISTFVFTTKIVKSLYFLNLKFHASSHLLWLSSLVCVGPGQKPWTDFLAMRLISYEYYI